MARQSKFVQIALERGYVRKDGTPNVTAMLVDQMNESGTVERAAVALGIGYHHVVRKAQSLGIRRHPGTFYATEDAS